MSRIRLGVVDFSNSRPLVWDLESDPEFELFYDHPAAVADQLASGRVDAGLVPLAAHYAGVGEAWVPGVSIASTGPVWSVKLFGPELPTESSHVLYRVGVDHRSRSSVALLKILLEPLAGPPVDFVVVDAAQCLGEGGEVLDADLDAVLAIGDLALVRPGGWDLGEAWARRIGLPFVYALWVTASTIDPSSLAPRLQLARDRGLEQMGTYLPGDPRVAHLDPGLLEAYLSKAIDYRLTTDHLEGMKVFRQALVSGAGDLTAR